MVNLEFLDRCLNSASSAEILQVLFQTQTMATTADDPTFFQIQSQSLAFLGLDITTKANSKWKRVLGICNCICAALFLSLCFSQLKVVSQGNDLQLQVLCYLISMIIGVFLANVKMNVIRSQSKDFIELSTLLKDLYLSVDSNDREKLRGVNKLAQIMAWVNLVCLLSSTTLLIFYPLKVAIEQFYDEGFFYWPHPFPTAIPFVDTSAFPAHALIHLLFIYGLVAISFATCAADSLFVETSLLLSCHFQLLQRNIEALNYEDMDEELRRIFLYHRNILKTKDALLRSYRRILSIFFLVAHVMFGLFVICALQVGFVL